MLCREIIAVCSEIHTKHINTLCGQNVELLNVKLEVTYSDHCALKVLIYITRKISPYRAVNTVSLMKTSQLMLCREIVAVCSQIHTKRNCTVGRTQKF